MASVRNFLDTLSKLEVPGAAVSLPAALPLPSFAFSGATAATSEAPGAPHSAGITAPALTGSDLATSEADHGAGSTASGPDDPAETTHIYEPFSVRHGLSPSAWSKRYERSKKNIRVPWTHEETSALEQGVRRFGTRWSTILRAPGLGEPLVRNARSSVDLKDKWRNWSNRLRKARNPLGWVASKDPVPRDVFLRALQEKIPLRGTPGFQAAMALSDPGSPDRAAKHTGGRPPAVPVQPVVDVGLPPSDPVSAAAALQAAATTLPGASGAAPAASAALSLGMPGLPVSVSMLTASSLSATALLPSGSLTQQALPAPGELTQPPSTVGAPTPGASAKRTRSTLADASAAVGGTATSEMLGLSAAEAAEPSAKRPALAEQTGQDHRQAGGDAASQGSPAPGPSFSAPSGADASSASPVQFRVTHLSNISLGHAPSAPLTLGAKPHDVMAAVVQQAKSAFGVDSDAFLLVDVQIPKGFSVASNRRTVEQYYGSEARTVELVALSGEGCAEAAAALLHGGIAKQ